MVYQVDGCPPESTLAKEKPFKTKPVLCYIGAKGDRVLPAGRSFDFTSVIKTVQKAVDQDYIVKVIDIDDVARLFGAGDTSPEKEQWRTEILNCDVLVYDLTTVVTDYCHPAPPMSLAYYIGQRNPKQALNTTLKGSRESPIPYRLFGQLFRPVLEQHDGISSEMTDGIEMYEKWAPVTVLRYGGASSGLWRICNVTTSDADCWNIDENDLRANYMLQEKEIGPELLETDDQGVGLRECLREFFAGEESLMDEINWSEFQLTLKFERERVGVESTWCIARPRNIVVAMPMSQQVVLQRTMTLSE